MFALALLNMNVDEVNDLRLRLLQGSLDLSSRDEHLLSPVITLAMSVMSRTVLYIISLNGRHTRNGRQVFQDFIT